MPDPSIVQMQPGAPHRYNGDSSPVQVAEFFPYNPPASLNPGVCSCTTNMQNALALTDAIQYSAAIAQEQSRSTFVTQEVLSPQQYMHGILPQAQSIAADKANTLLGR